MQRMGHGSMRAALIYQHATHERERQIAAASSELADGQSHDQPGSSDELHAGPGWWR